MYRSGLLLCLFTAVSALTFCFGCSPQPGPPPGSEVPAAGPALDEPGTAPAGQVEADEDADDVTLDILTWDEVAELPGQHPGKVVVMDLWATYCPPCVAEFPHLVALQREYPEQVRCISVSLTTSSIMRVPP
jgi:thiol-disulfide isomerase/thioredoxin